MQKLDKAAVFAALISERQYQRLRWGIRQADGSFLEIPRTCYDFLGYVSDYLAQAISSLTCEVGGQANALIEARKFAALAVAYFEGSGPDQKMFLESLTIPETFPTRGSLMFYLLKIQWLVLEGINRLGSEVGGVPDILRDIVVWSTIMFMECGVPSRSLEGVVNIHDQQPASMP